MPKLANDQPPEMDKILLKDPNFPMGNTVQYTIKQNTKWPIIDQNGRIAEWLNS